MEIAIVWAAGAILILSGLAYSVGLLASQQDWAGPTSLRKPLLFGLSTGVTLLSVAGVIAILPRRWIDRPLYAGLAVALVVEVLLIDIQQARGVASHFNYQTPIDRGVSVAMTALILFASAVLVEITVRAFGPVAGAEDDLLTARAGMVLLVVGCGLGAMITVAGDRNLVMGRPPELYGDAGVLKFPHGVPLHAIQVFFVQSRFTRWLGMDVRTRVRSMTATIVGFAAATLYGIHQTWQGAARFPPEGWAWLSAALSGVGFAAAIVIVVVGCTRRSTAA